ncbi:MAG TPA: thiamine phosphate synthase [Candidatus Bacteroides merdavium]|uniref:Thiamine-phosphate synthase n=1 Tax=Candidatus Bacteroides merdavium TaxID=2838472 RepID=A0A9D2KDJ0_9BACE|nr:thiamine phosphate synthase [Candidatus Bacteroides merdavium]
MFQVQFITHYTETISYLESARIALEGGCRWIQLRMKDATDEEVEPVAREVQTLCRDFGAYFVLDDRVELVKRLHTDGVHLGKLDMPVDEARAYLGPEFIIGGTANTFDDVQRLHRAGADYIGCGPFRYTTTKKNLAPILGLEGYRNILLQMEEWGINLPVVGIGGIGADDIADLKAAGLNGIALSGSILRAQDPVDEMKRIIELTQK